ncbi:MAG: hypothetical protein K5892_06940 [Acholeplasmatales bacterium]|nr:hypothetical protein [Acholeplasmatales bacterium]
MLSRYDIEKEFGKNISIYPFNGDNIKENSINLTASDLAWTQTNFSAYIDETSIKAYSKKTSNLKEYTFKKGEKAIIEIFNEKYIVLAPHSVTLIETEEVISTGPKIGGDFHSKVGLSAIGIGHIGTMLGPNFSGKCLIPLHNVTEDIVLLKTTKTIVSVTFEYLKSSMTNESNPTTSGHIEKLSQYGISISENDSKKIIDDWMTRFNDVKDKMEESESYNKYLKSRKKRSFKEKWLTTRNIIIGSFVAIVVITSFVLSLVFECKGNTKWADRLWPTFFSLLISGTGFLLGFVRPR